MSDCPMCDGPAGILGTLGTLVHFICRNCGWQFSTRKQEDEDDGSE